MTKHFTANDKTNSYENNTLNMPLLNNELDSEFATLVDPFIFEEADTMKKEEK